MRRAAQIHQYNHLVLNLLIYHEVVTMSKAYFAFIKSPGERALQPNRSKFRRWPENRSVYARKLPDRDNARQDA
jgi:hypothetical protein